MSSCTVSTGCSLVSPGQGSSNREVCSPMLHVRRCPHVRSGLVVPWFHLDKGLSNREVCYRCYMSVDVLMYGWTGCSLVSPGQGSSNREVCSPMLHVRRCPHVRFGLVVPWFHLDKGPLTRGLFTDATCPSMSSCTVWTGCSLVSPGQGSSNREVCSPMLHVRRCPHVRFGLVVPWFHLDKGPLTERSVHRCYMSVDVLMYGLDWLFLGFTWTRVL
ncbi:hypothetical protein BSL78_20233 [Apostichopus japonicus]|uniref:Uncharacterized protein n=1 Tax=Stichopus japonicus TaxID=307972 RepID=A0A2G8K4H9_STIJA|nr:hypothetical protein BSL78_20233 [Apostichopus japonicus]